MASCKKTSCSSKRIYKHSSPNILKILKANNLGIKLDVGCGGNKQPGFVGLDIRPIKDIVDIVHDAESVPYPLPDECCSTILCSHLIEHLCPKNFIKVMNEWWRLMKVGGQLWASLPYGNSYGYVQDPSHCNAVNETTWTYFSPYHPMYTIYYPKPWKIERNAWWENGNMEVILKKVTEKEAEQCLNPK